jgi:TPR repeat protein
MQIINAIRTTLFVAIISLGVGSAAVADPFDDGFDAYDRGDFETALRVWHPLADQGDARAQYNLGVIYEYGEGVPENDVQAYKWMNLAAAQGNETAKKNKGIVEKEMTREQIAEAQRLSAKWKPVSEK